MSQRRLIRLIISALLVVALSYLGVGVSQKGQVTAPTLGKPVQPGYYQVTKVDDGDTIQVAIAGKKETVRFIGIDTPETKDPRKPVQCFGKVASQKTHELLDGKTVRLESDPGGDNRDKYQRLLRYIYLSDGTFINQYLVQNGYAFAYTIFPNSKLEQFRGWEREAREANKGLWSGCKVTDTDDKRQTNNQ